VWDTWIKGIATIAPIISAVAACVVAAMAINAARIWRLTLRQQRADECMSAARDLSAAVDHFMRVKIKENLTHVGTVIAAYEETLASWRRFDRTFGTACRYYPDLEKSIAKQIRGKLEILEDLIKAN
jgi:hypothetical protein